MTNSVVDETVKVVEEATEVAMEPVKEMTKALPKKGKTAAIIAGSALAVVGVYFGYKKLIEPRFRKDTKKAHVNVDCQKSEATPVEVEAEMVEEPAEPKRTGKKK